MQPRHPGLEARGREMTEEGRSHDNVERPVEAKRFRVRSRYDTAHAEGLLLKPDRPRIDFGDRDLLRSERPQEEAGRAAVAAGEIEQRAHTAQSLETPADDLLDRLEDLPSRRKVQDGRRLPGPVRRHELEAVHLVGRMDARRKAGTSRRVEAAKVGRNLRPAARVEGRFFRRGHRAPASSEAETENRPTLPTTETESARPSSTRRASASTCSSVTASTFAISSSTLSVRRK